MKTIFAALASALLVSTAFAQASAPVSAGAQANLKATPSLSQAASDVKTTAQDGAAKVEEKTSEAGKNVTKKAHAVKKVAAKKVHATKAKVEEKTSKITEPAAEGTSANVQAGATAKAGGDTKTNATE